MNKMLLCGIILGVLGGAITSYSIYYNFTKYWCAGKAVIESRAISELCNNIYANCSKSLDEIKIEGSTAAEFCERAGLSKESCRRLCGC